MTNEELTIEIQEGRAGLGDLWERVHRLIRQEAWRYFTQHAGTCAHAGVELDDLVQCGFLALQDTVQAFDPARGYTMLTYLRYPLLNRFREACGIRTTRRDPLNHCASLDKPVGEEESSTLGELTPDPRAATEMEAAEERAYRQELRQALETALNMLGERQRDVIRRRFWNGETLDTIATDMNVGRERIRQNEQMALRDLRRGRCLRLLKPFAEEIRTGYAYQGTGWAAWNSTGVSSVERAAERLAAIMHGLEQDKTDLCTLLHISPEELERRIAIKS